MPTDKKALKRNKDKPPRPCKAFGVGVPLTPKWGVECEGYDFFGTGTYDSQHEAENSEEMLKHLRGKPTPHRVVVDGSRITGMWWSKCLVGDFRSWEVFSTREEAQNDPELLEHIANEQRATQKPASDSVVTMKNVGPTAPVAEGL